MKDEKNGSANGRRKHPNVLLICTDHWPAHMMGAAGHPRVMTPTIDQMARNGVRFSNAYSATPVCVPARRALMTGMTSKNHGCRQNKAMDMPDAPTVAQAFSDAGYQTFAVGKLHVTPQRNRIGFDDVILHEEGRHEAGMTTDDYEQYLTDQGFHGQQFAHGMSNNEYTTRPWHLPEHTHPTAWTAREMGRMIKRRDPTRPGFWYMSFTQPHPPLVPVDHYVDMYREVDIPEPDVGHWATRFHSLPHALKESRNMWDALNLHERKIARRAFYALCTHIDHQIRLVIGTLREEGLLDNTIVCFTSDHGDMLGHHLLCRKSVFYEGSANIPLIIVPTAHDDTFHSGQVDDRLVELRDIMPTLLQMAGIDVPASVDGLSLVDDHRRDTLYGECRDGHGATRMIRDARHKLIYYPTGNRLQLFDLQEDPRELQDVSDEKDYAAVKDRLTAALMAELYGSDRQWIRDGQLVGVPDRTYTPRPNRGLSGQRGWHFY